MDNRFLITIGAVDKATAVMKRINRNMANLAQPFTTIGRSMRSLGREIALNPIVKSVMRLGRAASSAAKWIGRVVGPIVGLTGAATIAGVVALADAWGRAGIMITNAAARIGLGVGQLQAFRGAATAAGLSADDMQGSLVQLGDTLQDAVAGRNQMAMAMLARIGVTLHRDAAGVIDTAQAMDDIADAIARIKIPATQALVARQFGLENMLPVLRKGSQGLHDFEDEARRMGAVNEAAAAANARYGESWNRLKLAIEGAANAISIRAMPGLTNIMDAITNFVAPKQPGLMGPPAWAAGQGSPLAGVKQIRGAPPLAASLNNPGNIRAWPGMTTLGGFAQFPDVTSGIAAMVQNLQTYQQKYGINSISGILNRWAPPGENDTESYIKDVTEMTGFGRHQGLNLQNRAMLLPLISSMIKHEQGTQPFSQEQLTAGINAGLAKGPPVEITVSVPPGARVDAKAGGQVLPVKISYSMPTMVTP